LLRGLRELKPAVVHFSGDGAQNDLFFHRPNGQSRIVSPEAIAEEFAAAGPSVDLIVLNACFSEAAAEAARKSREWRSTDVDTEPGLTTTWS